MTVYHRARQTSGRDSRDGYSAIERRTFSSKVERDRWVAENAQLMLVTEYADGVQEVQSA